MSVAVIGFRVRFGALEDLLTAQLQARYKKWFGETANTNTFRQLDLLINQAKDNLPKIHIGPCKSKKLSQHECPTSNAVILFIASL